MAYRKGHFALNQTDIWPNTPVSKAADLRYVMLMSDTVSPIERILAARAPEIAAREAKARALADKALAELKKAGISAWIVGSLARGNFGLYSDVDFVVDGDHDVFWASIPIIEEAMGSFPFDIIPYQGVPENQRQFYLKVDG